MFHFSREDLGISLEYPTFFTPLSAPSPQVLLLLRPPTGRYPTFNVLLQMGDPQVETKSIAQLKGDIVDSYRAVGLFDAEVQFSEKRQVAGRTAYYARIAYKQRDERINSSVYIVPGRDAYYVCTLISDAENVEENEKFLTGIIGTLVVKEPPPPPPSPSQTGSPLFWFAAFLGVLLTAKIMFALFKRQQ